MVNCPKCGMKQDAGRADCISCGVVFERWRELQERALLGKARNTQNVPVPASSGTPWWMVAVVLLVFVLFGTMWTKNRREARAAHDPAAAGKAMINDINNRNVKARQRMEQESSRMKWLSASSAPRELPRPVGFDEADATALLNDCPGLAEPLTIHLPKSFRDYEAEQMRAGFPHLRFAESHGVLLKTVDNGLVTYEVGQSAGGMRIVDSGAEFVVELGSRKVANIVRLAGSVDAAEAEFGWTYEDRVGMRVFLGNDSYLGRASFLKNGGRWRIREALLWNNDNTMKKVCG